MTIVNELGNNVKIILIEGYNWVIYRYLSLSSHNFIISNTYADNYTIMCMELFKEKQLDEMIPPSSK